jgi:hypothetical protein
VAGIEHLRSTTYKADDKTKQGAFYQPLLLPKELTPEELEKEEYIGDATIANHDKAKEHKGGGEHSKALSRAEIRALTLYASDRYDFYNTALRGNNLSVPTEENAQKRKDKADSEIAVLVSALNKLPQYSGVAYRMINAFNDFNAAVKPGGVFTDLGFVSASMTAQGAEIGGASGGATKPGALETYVVFRTKAAASMTILGISKETEVIFRPGTRFKVDAIWQYVNGKVPRGASQEAQRILLRNGEEKTVYKKDVGTFKGKVRVVEMTEI